MVFAAGLQKDSEEAMRRRLGLGKHHGLADHQKTCRAAELGLEPAGWLLGVAHAKAREVADALDFAIFSWLGDCIVHGLVDGCRSCVLGSS